MSKHFHWVPTVVEQVKHLYLNELMSPKEISERTGVPVQKIYNKINADKWAKMRRKIDKKIGTTVTKAAKASVQRHTRFLAQCADESEQMITKGFRMAKEADSPRLFGAAAGATKTFLDIYRKAAGLDSNTSSRTTNVQVNFAHTGPFAPRPVVQVSTSEDLEVDDDQGEDLQVIDTPAT